VKAVVHVMPKPDVLDPQGQAIARASASLGHAAVRGVRQGKVFEVELEAADPARALSLVEELCQKLLANPVIEDFSIERLES
jgi:phosphoribosylformylglycinamidine synthase